MGYHQTKHDLGLLRADTTAKVGLMLVRNKDGSFNPNSYLIIDDEYLAEHQAATPGYDSLRPEREIQVGSDSHRAGFGLDVYDSDDPERYLSSKNMDLRFRGMAICGPKATAVTNSITTTAPTITDAGLEIWDNSTLTNWTKSGNATLAKESTIIHANSGSYSAKLNGGTSGRLHQDLATTQIQGRRFTITGWVYCETASTASITINDGVSSTQGPQNATTGAWEQLTVTRTLDQAATQLRIELDKDTTTNYYVYFDDVAITRPTTIGYPVAFEDFNDIRYIGFSGGMLGKVNSGTTAVTDVYEFASPITSMKVFRDGYMYIALESSQIIENCEDDWADGTHGTSDLDTSDYKVGSGSVKITGSSVANGDIIAYEDITAQDLSGFTGVTLWIKSSATVAAADLVLALDNTAACASPVESISLPALTAGQWTKVYVRMATPANCKAIISVGLEYNANAADTIIHLDDIRAESSYYYMDSGENVTQSTLSNATHDSFAKYFQPVLTTMWKGLPPNNIYSATDPSNIGAANWSAVTTVDTPSNNITGLASNGTSLYVPKEDRCFYIDSNGAVQVLIGETEHIAASTSGKNTFVWKGKTYYPCGDQSLVEYDAGTITWRSPSLHCTNLSAFNGRVMALAGDNQWLHAILDNDTEVEVLAGRLEAVNTTAQWVWHPICQITLAGCETAHISGIGRKALWIASTDSTDSLYYIPLYTGYGNPLGDSNRSFDTSATMEFETPWLHGNFKGDIKDWIKNTCTMESTTANVYFEVHYMKLGDADYTKIDDYKTSPRTTKFLTTETDDVITNVETAWIRLKFVAKTNSTTATPILKEYDLRGILKPTRRKIIMAKVKCADDTKDKEGNPLEDDAAAISTALWEARNATGLVTIWDIDGTAKYCNILPVSPFEQIPVWEKDRPRERIFNLYLQEVALS